MRAGVGRRGGSSLFALRFLFVFDGIVIVGGCSAYMGGGIGVGFVRTADLGVFFPACSTPAYLLAGLQVPARWSGIW